MTPENKITCRLPTILLFLESEYQIQENHDNIIHIAIVWNFLKMIFSIYNLLHEMKQISYISWPLYAKRQGFFLGSAASNNPN